MRSHSNRRWSWISARIIAKSAFIEATAAIRKRRKKMGLDVTIEEDEVGNATGPVHIPSGRILRIKGEMYFK